MRQINYCINKIYRQFSVIQLILVLSLCVTAQSVETAKLRGIIIDSEGARVDSRNIVLESPKYKKEFGTKKDGEFEVEVSDGTYKLTVESQGFEKYQQDDLVLEAGKTKSIEIKMKVKLIPCKSGICL